MKIAYTFLIKILTAFLSAFLSSFITGLFLEGGMFFTVIVLSFIFTLSLGIPVSLGIHMLIQSNQSIWIFVKLIAHAIAGPLILFIYVVIEEMNFLSGFNEKLMVFYIAALINAVVYFATYTFLKKEFFGHKVF